MLNLEFNSHLAMWEWDQTQFLCFPGVAFLVGGGRLIHPLPYPPVPHHFLSTSGKKNWIRIARKFGYLTSLVGRQTHTTLFNPCCLFQPSSWWRSWLSRARQGRAGVNSGKEWGRLLVLCVHKHSRAAGRKGKKMCRTRLQAVWSFCNPTLAWNVNASPEPD